MPAALNRPHPFAAEPSRPDDKRGKPLAPTWTVCSASARTVVAETAAIVCERLWVSAPSTIIDLAHLHLD